MKRTLLVFLRGQLVSAAMRHSSDTTKQVMQDVSHAVSAIIHKVIAFAPVGIFGLVAVTLQMLD